MQGIKTLSSLQVPVYVTETGIPDRSGNKRAKFFDAYIPQVRASRNASWAQTSNTHTLFCFMAAFFGLTCSRHIVCSDELIEPVH